MCPVLSPWRKVHRWRKVSWEEMKGQWDSRLMWILLMCDMCTAPTFSESIHLCQPFRHRVTPFVYTRGVQQPQGYLSRLRYDRWGWKDTHSRMSKHRAAKGQLNYCRRIIKIETLQASLYFQISPVYLTSTSFVIFFGIKKCFITKKTWLGGERCLHCVWHANGSLKLTRCAMTGGHEHLWTDQ